MSNLKSIKNNTVAIKLLDGKERTLRYTLNAMTELEDRYGSVEEAFKQLEEGRIKAVRCVLWAGLIHEDPTLTELEVGNLIDMRYMSDLMNSMNNAIDNDMPESNEQESLNAGDNPNA